MDCRGGQGDLYEQLNYEAIKEQAGMDDSQLVYVSFSNQALAHLPYMVALDESSRCATLPFTGTLFTRSLTHLLIYSLLRQHNIALAEVPPTALSLINKICKTDCILHFSNLLGFF